MWIIAGLILAATSVSTLGASFSILGLRDLFSGAPLSVMAMGAGLEFGKFVLAAYLHQRWQHTRIIMKSYMVFSIVILSGITSMGIFGYLSNAYQSANLALETENAILQNLNAQQSRIQEELMRISANVDEIPDSRISRKLAARNEAEPKILALKGKMNEVFDEIAKVKLKILEVQNKVGPLIYVAKMFDINIDIVVKWLILVFVTVFDPLAICLVIASSDALRNRHLHSQQNADSGPAETANSQAGEVPADGIIQMRFSGDNKDKVG